MRPSLTILAVLVLCGACARAPTPRDALHRIVHQQCIPHADAGQRPAPCERLSGAHEAGGYALLHDRKGGVHFLLIPTAEFAGIESAELRRPGAPNFFARAWAARDLVDGRLGRPVARETIGLAVNPRRARSQDQFHIHIECLRADVHADLSAVSAQIGDSWTRLEVAGRPFLARRVLGEELGVNPLELLARERPETTRDMGAYTLVVAGMSYAGAPGFALLVNDSSAGELLLDSTCVLTALK